MAAKQIRIQLSFTEKERDYLTEAYKKYVSLTNGEILTMNRWMLTKIIEAIKNETE